MTSIVLREDEKWGNNTYRLRSGNITIRCTAMVVNPQVITITDSTANDDYPLTKVKQTFTAFRIFVASDYSIGSSTTFTAPNTIVTAFNSPDPRIDDDFDIGSGGQNLEISYKLEGTGRLYVRNGTVTGPSISRNGTLMTSRAAQVHPEFGSRTNKVITWISGQNCAGQGVAVTYQVGQFANTQR